MLERLRDFPGAYIQGRYGLALGTASTGDQRLKNGNGVIMRLVAKRQGLMLSLGGDAVVIQNEPVISIAWSGGGVCSTAWTRPRAALTRQMYTPYQLA